MTTSRVYMMKMKKIDVRSQRTEEQGKKKPEPAVEKPAVEKPVVEKPIVEKKKVEKKF